MEPEKQQPNCQQPLIEFQGQLFKLKQPAPGKISLCFDELNHNLIHFIANYQLAKVNYKTVLASLKGNCPHILSATLEKNPDELFVLTIKVSYQFLPQTIERIVFDKREITPQEAQQFAVNNMKNYLQNVKQQLSALTNMKAISGKIDNKANPFQVCVKIPHKKTIFTWGLNLNKLGKKHAMKASFLLYNSTTKQKKDTNAIPQSGIYIYHAKSDPCYTQLRFYVQQQQQGYDHVIFSLKETVQGTYLISMEKVSES